MNPCWLRCRDGVHVAVLFQRKPRCNARAAVFRGFDHQHASRHAADDPVADGKILRRWRSPTGNSVISAPPRATICSVSLVFSLGYMTSIPVPRTATVFPLAATAPRCDAVSMPRANPLMITRPRDARSAEGVRPCRCRRAWDGASQPWQCRVGNRTATLPFTNKITGRVVDFLQARRIFGIAERNDSCARPPPLSRTPAAPVPWTFRWLIDCAETARIPVPSSSVRLA
jgi:hypothetical protein